jgi:hypothetical protein
LVLLGSIGSSRLREHGDFELWFRNKILTPHKYQHGYVHCWPYLYYDDQVFPITSLPLVEIQNLSLAKVYGIKV